MCHRTLAPAQLAHIQKSASDIVKTESVPSSDVVIQLKMLELSTAIVPAIVKCWKSLGWISESGETNARLPNGMRTPLYIFILFYVFIFILLFYV